jgi:general secretion pathway protein D
VEGHKATLKIGSKYPILTSQYIGATTTGGQVSTPTPSFTFEDLGVVINVTPHVHDMGEVTLDFDGELKVLGAGTVDNIPIISSRKITSMFRLRNNESALIAGLTSETVTRTTTGPALFSRIPILGNLISMFTRNKSHNYILMVIKPRLLSLPPNQRVMRAIWVGSETRDVTPL